MTKTQNNVLEFLGKYKSATDKQLKFFTNCSIQDINYLTSLSYIKKDARTNLYYHKTKKLDVRTAVALDVIVQIKNEIKDFEYSRNYPVIFSCITNDNKTCDIAVVRKVEQKRVFTELEQTYSRADKIIIVLENDDYDKKLVKSRKEVLICKYPIEIIDKIN